MHSRDSKNVANRFSAAFKEGRLSFCTEIAATLAALLGEDYNAAKPKAGKPIADVLLLPNSKW